MKLLFFFMFLSLQLLYAELTLPILFCHSVSVTDSHKGTQSTHDDRKGKDPMDDVDPQGVGIMLPDDEAALLSGALDCLDLSESPGQVLVALEDCDLFCGGGKMELDSDPKESIAVDSYLGNVNHQYTLASGVGTISVAHPHCEHPSRTLFVRNVDNNVEDSELRSLFEVTVCVLVV